MSQMFLRNATSRVAEALQGAIMELANMQKSVVTAEMMVLALMEQKDSVVLKLFSELGQDVHSLRRRISDEIIAHAQTLPGFIQGSTAGMRISQELQNLFKAAEIQRKKFQDDYVSTGVLFLAAFDETVPGIKSILIDAGLEYDSTYKALTVIRGNLRIDQKDDESRQSLLDSYTTDLTAKARRGELDPVIGRESEIERVVEILSRRKKNNPVLVGEPGVGKTVIIEGLAQRIVTAEVPEHLLGKRVLSLEMGALIAGAKMQGEFEERLKTIIDEVTSAAGEIFIFIDELHTVVGTGRSAGGLDASNMLKPALARGQFQCIGATTNREYKQFIESDKALERRFQPVRVREPNIAQTIDILRGLRKNYEDHHHITYSDQAFIAAAELAHKYITERQLPDKAIDLLDEAGAAKRLQLIKLPSAMKSLEAQKQKISDLKSEAFVAQDFEQMARHQMELSKIESELNKFKSEMKQNVDIDDRTVGPDDIGQVVHRLTGIPVSRMLADEADQLANLEEKIRERVVGQSAAVLTVSNAIRRNRSGVRKHGAPIASFLFLGPTGVGKTELAKAIAEEVMGDESKIIRLDMSEFMEKHSISKIIGSPPGYIGYGEGGQLTERVRQNPYSVVLLDEFEKAHPDIYNLLLQVFDEGWLTDSEGQRVSFRDAIIIGTSNLGSDHLISRKRPLGIGVSGKSDDRATVRDLIMNDVKNFLRPELINRIDEIIIFEQLGHGELTEILEIQLGDLAKRLSELGIKLVVKDSVKTALLEGMEESPYGARPLERRVEQTLESLVATAMIQKKVRKDGTEIEVDYVNNNYTLKIND